MRSRKTPFIGLASFVLFAFCLMGGLASSLWAASFEDERVAKLVEGAKKEGNIAWYTIMSVPESSVMAKKFETKYPFVKIEILRNNATLLFDRVMSEASAKVFKADVISTQGLTSHVMKQKGLFQKYMSPQSASYPEGAKDPDGYGTAVYLNTKVIGYNTKLVAPKDVPGSFQDLLDPKWKGGKISVDTDNYEWFGNMLNILGRAKGLELMKRISLQQPQIRTGQTLRTTLLAAGEFSLAAPVNADGVERFKSQAAPIEWVAVEPVITLKHMASVSAHAPHPNASKLFIDFMLSKEGQDIIRSVGRIPARPDIEPIAVKLTRGVKLTYSDHSIADNYTDIRREYDDIFKWKKF